MTNQLDLLACWVSSQFSVLVPRTDNKGYLKVPYGHHNDGTLREIEDVSGYDVFGLEGALDFQVPGRIFHDGIGHPLRQEFERRVIPALEKRYKRKVRLVDENEFWRNHPVIDSVQALCEKEGMADDGSGTF